MKDIPVKINGDFVEAAEWNSPISTGELKNAVTTSGQTLSEPDSFQLSKAMAVYAADSTYYQDTGAANAYVLSAINPRKAPEAYSDGMIVRFKATNANTGASTVNVSGIGVKDIRNRDGSAVQSGEIGAGDYIDLVFELSNDYFVITNRSDISNNIPFGVAVETSPNNYTIDLGGVYNAYDDRMFFRCRFPTVNTGTVTLNVEGLGAITLFDNGQSEVLIGDEIELNKVYLIAYSSGSSTLRLLNRITANTTIMNAGVSKTTDVTPYQVARVIQEGKYIKADASTTDGQNYTANVTPPLTTYTNDQEFHIYFTATNTSPNPTLNINGIGAREIIGQFSASLIAGDITSAFHATLVHDGSNRFVIKSYHPDETGSSTTARQSKLYAVTPYALDQQAATTSLKGLVEKATAAEVTAETADKYPDAADLKHHKGIAKAWATFSGETPSNPMTIYKSYNVDYIDRTSTGQYTAYWLSSFPDTNYAVTGFTDGDSRITLNSSTEIYTNRVNIKNADETATVRNPGRASIFAFSTN